MAKLYFKYGAVGNSKSAQALITQFNCEEARPAGPRLRSTPLDPQGRVLTEGPQVFLGRNDSYVAMCHRCWRRQIQRQQETTKNAGGFAL